MNSTVSTVQPSGPSAPVFSPLYQQIKALITRSLREGEWKPGEIIPSEAELAVRYGVSQGTVRKAIDELAADNLLMRRQGRGTFVATHHEDEVKFRFLRIVADDAATGGSLRMERRFLSCQQVRASEAEARLLRVKTGEALLQIRRVLLAQGKPLVFEDILLAGPAFTALTAQRLETYSGPLYALFESEFGTRMVRAEEKIGAVNADAEQAAALGVEPGHALLSVERIAYSYGEQPVELRRGLYVTDHHHYRNTLS